MPSAKLEEDFSYRMCWMKQSKERGARVLMGCNPNAAVQRQEVLRAQETGGTGTGQEEMKGRYLLTPLKSFQGQQDPKVLLEQLL